MVSFAEKCGISKQRLQNYLDGITSPNDVMAKIIVDTLNEWNNEWDELFISLLK